MKPDELSRAFYLTGVRHRSRQSSSACGRTPERPCTSGRSTALHPERLMSDDLLIDDPLTRKPWYRRWFTRRPGGRLGASFSRSGGHWSWRAIKWLAIVIVLVVVLYYPIGMVLTHKINDDPNFAAPQVVPGVCLVV